MQIVTTFKFFAPHMRVFTKVCQKMIKVNIVSLLGLATFTLIIFFYDPPSVYLIKRSSFVKNIKNEKQSSVSQCAAVIDHVCLQIRYL